MFLNKQEAVSCFQELGLERLDGCVTVIVNHVIEKCQESRQLAGTLLLRLITDELLTVDQFVNGSVCHMSSLTLATCIGSCLWPITLELITCLFFATHPTALLFFGCLLKTSLFSERLCMQYSRGFCSEMLYKFTFYVILSYIMESQESHEK